MVGLARAHLNYAFSITIAGKVPMKLGMEWNQLGHTLVKIYYVALAVPKFTSLFSVVLL